MGARHPYASQPLDLSELSCIDPTDPNVLVRDRSLLDQASACRDTDRLGVGSTPYNDPSSSRVMVPVTPTPNGKPRHLIRLAAVAVPTYGICRVRGLRQAVGIGQVFTETPEGDPAAYPIEIDQTSPFWAFQDGNISWHLRFLKGPPNGPVPGQNNGQPGKSTDLYATESGLLVRYPDLITPPNNGIVPGMELGGLGTFRDIRYPWGFGEVATLDFEVEGPGILVFFASVKQTNPATRQKIGDLGLTVTQRAQLLREEQFIAAFPNAIYRHVSGAILCEFGQLNRRPGINPTQGETPCG